MIQKFKYAKLKFLVHKDFKVGDCLNCPLYGLTDNIVEEEYDLGCTIINYSWEKCPLKIVSKIEIL